jgi:hypothetical protein
MDKLRKYRKEIALVVFLVLASLIIIWYAAGSANAQPVPKCIPAYTLDERNDVGGQIFSLTFLPMFLAVGGPVAIDEKDRYETDTQIRAACTVLAVAKHAVGLKEYIPQDKR